MAKAKGKAQKNQTVEETAQPTQGAVNKTEGVRQALAKLGADAPADAVMAFVSEQFGHILSKAHYFNIKSNLNKGGRKKGRRKAGRPKKTEAATNGTVAAATNGASSRGSRSTAGAFDLTDIVVLKELAGRYSARDLHALIDLVS